MFTPHEPALKAAIPIAIKNADTALSRNQILAKLPTKAMRSTLNVALDYLEKRGMILETKNGFIWTFNPGRKLARAEKELERFTPGISRSRKFSRLYR